MGFVTSFLSTGISHGLEGAGAEELTSGLHGAVLNAGMGAAFSAAQGGDPWIGGAGSLIGYLANQARRHHLLRYPKGYSEGTYNRWDADLGEHMKESVSLKEFYEQTKGMSLSQMIGEGGTINSQPSGPVPRYVRHPYHRGVVVDMRHFLAVGRLGEGMGTLVEVFQSAAGDPSGMKYQDFFSNRLGHYFRMEYEMRLLANPNAASMFITSFFLDHRNTLK